jgi:hypothetical protein
MATNPGARLPHSMAMAINDKLKTVAKNDIIPQKWFTCLFWF